MAPSSCFIIDGNAFLYKSFYAIKGLISSDGIPTNAIYGFCNTVLKVINQQQPAYVAVAFDSKGPTFRVEKDPEYKANRKKMPEDLATQIPYINNILDDLNIAVYRQAGIEADDIIATVVDRYASEELDIYIVGLDKDLCQLVGRNVFMFDPAGSTTMKIPDIVQKYSVVPERLVFLQALIGDASDNIKGAKGIGRKTAEKLLARFDDIDDIYGNLSAVKNKRVRTLLAESRDAVYLSLELVRLKRDVKINEMSLSHMARPEKYNDQLMARLDELNLDRIKKQVLEIWPLKESF